MAFCTFSEDEDKHFCFLNIRTIFMYANSLNELGI